MTVIFVVQYEYLWNILCPKQQSLSVKCITVTITILLLKSSAYSLMVYLYGIECTMPVATW